jgi:hypothetical protein
LLPATGCSVDTPIGAPAATTLSILASASPRPCTTEVGLLALKKRPRPLTAVCQ